MEKIIHTFGEFRRCYCTKFWKTHQVTKAMAQDRPYKMPLEQEDSIWM